MKTYNRLHYNRIYLICGLAMATSEIWKQLCLTFIVNYGHYYWWYFPFQLCSIPMYICLILPWAKSVRLRKILLTFLMDFGMLGGIFTFFDTSGLHYSYAPLTVHSFAWHILLILLGLTAGLSLESDYSWKGYARCTALYGGTCIIATILNMVLYRFGAINMFYISPHYYITQVIFKDIAEFLGNTPGIFIYIASIVSGAFVFHLIWHLIYKNKKE
ncbi:YwaF family protein [Extibacter muris]|uniref:TMEM164 family acyltransferase n=1 Tax=Extibacter muris TaxID=1796622 RepID=UPI00210C10F0|nr:YwaF family protein [Extibacter muris]MCQ4663588.1 YwaF family protein [Extibacter muris]MCQ4695039.1 YwaF family protein [Extibacter muris]